MTDHPAENEGRYERDFDDYLSKACDQLGCDLTATHNQSGWKVCNTHLDPDAPSFARDD